MQDRSRGKLSFLAATLLTSTIVAACSSDTTEPPGGNDDNVILMQARTFSPLTRTISVGETITWRNATAEGHTITSNDNEWTRQVVPQEEGWEFEHTFDTAGTYDYECEFHNGMTGTIEVVE